MVLGIQFTAYGYKGERGKEKEEPITERRPMPTVWTLEARTDKDREHLAYELQGSY
jgi:hypothetical protein